MLAISNDYEVSKTIYINMLVISNDYKIIS